MPTPKPSNRVEFSPSDSEGSDLSSLDSMDEHQALPSYKMNGQALSTSTKRRPSNENLNYPNPNSDTRRISDTSSLTDIVSNWGSDSEIPEKLSTELNSVLAASLSNSTLVEGTTLPTGDHESSLSSLTSEENTNVQPKGSVNRTKRLNLQSKLNLFHPNDMDRAGRTQLFRYAERGDLESCRKLILARADVNVKDNAGWSPLHLASARGAARIVQLFVDNHADIHASGLMRQTALHDAALSGSLETIRILIEAGADIHARNLDGQSPIDLCTQSDCLEYLVEQFNAKSSINQHNHEGQSRLHLACLADDKLAVTKLLDDGADVNVLNSQKITPLHIAAQLGSTDIIAGLIHRGALVNTQDSLGYTGLHFAAENNHVMAVKMLLEHRSDPLISNYRHQLPLDLSDDEMVKSLIRDHIIQYSSRAMDMDRLLPRNNKSSVIESPSSDRSKSLPETPAGEARNGSPKKIGPNQPSRPNKPNKKANKSQFKTNRLHPNHKPPDIKVVSNRVPNSSPSLSLSSFSPVHSQHNQFHNNPLNYVHPLDSYLNGNPSQVINLSLDSCLSQKLPFIHCQESKHPVLIDDCLESKPLIFNSPVCKKTPSPGLIQAVRESIGFTPIYCVLLPSILNEGFLALDFQVQLFLRLPDSQSLLVKYPTIFRRKLTTCQKQLMWPPIKQMLNLNKISHQQTNQIRYKEFLRRNLHFIKWRDVLDIVFNDYSLLHPILENVAFDINYQTSVDKTTPSLPGDEGFPPSDFVISSKRDVNRVANRVTNKATNRVTNNLINSYSSYNGLDYIGPPEYVRRLTTFLQKHPELNPRPELPLVDGIRLFISNKRHCLSRAIPYP